MTDLAPGPAWLFCPADRPDRFAKAAERADVVILDLEDGVAAVDRPRARDALTRTRLDPARTVVRVNPVGSADHAEDLAAVSLAGYLRIMLAKTESREQVSSVEAREVVALCETPAGIVNSAAI